MIINEHNKNGYNIKKASDESDWRLVKDYRQKHFFDERKIEDPYQWTFRNVNHQHLLIYRDNHLLGYAHVQLWPLNRAALRIIVIDKNFRNKGIGSTILAQIENWLKNENYSRLHIESSPEALNFYLNNNYIDMPFDDPDGYVGSPEDTPLGKIL